MSSIQEFRMYFYKKALQQKLQQQTIKRKTTDFQQAKTIGILFDATDLAQREVILKYAKTLEKQAKKVKLLGYLNDKQCQENLTFPHYSNKEISWKLEPQSESIQQFLQTPLDILMVLNTQTNIQFEYISTLAKANLRVGAFTDNIYAYDFMVDTSAKKNLKDFILLVEKYLNKTSTLHEQATV